KDTENKIIGNLLREPLKSKSLHQIALDTKLMYVTVHKIVPILLKRKIVKQERKGKANLISIDFENAKIDDLSSAILHEKSKLMKKHPQIAILIKDIEEALSGKLYILLLFGSYAKEKEKKGSDVDLLFIISDRKDTEAYKEKINKALKLSTLKKDFNIVTTDDFINMLNQKYTVGREAFEQGMVLFGIEPYYAMVKEHAKKRGY
ncbi:MAG: nucleotidyltransferase domain-containing protein, partial [Nanoarchaeota archaeon]|nr:nucleotidyltransferase domain-containing protein [Nanoarchaeota archaeon]